VEEAREFTVVSAIQNARRLRRDQTKAEDIFWQEVRNRNFLGLKFRRQVPIGKYIADFVCEPEKLIIELDGNQHAEHETHDENRTQKLEDHGYRVVRYWNADIFKDLDGVFTELTKLVGDGCTK
jgi:very-short-patch-repair endonuclease